MWHVLFFIFLILFLHYIAAVVIILAGVIQLHINSDRLYRMHGCIVKTEQTFYELESHFSIVCTYIYIYLCMYFTCICTIIVYCDGVGKVAPRWRICR